MMLLVRQEGILLVSQLTTLPEPTGQEKVVTLPEPTGVSRVHPT